MDTIDWLLDSDPAIRWQVLRDLAGAPPQAVATERSRVASEGWGARLLALQGEDGQVGGRRVLSGGGMAARRGGPALDLHSANPPAAA